MTARKSLQQLSLDGHPIPAQLAGVSVPTVCRVIGRALARHEITPNMAAWLLAEYVTRTAY